MNTCPACGKEGILDAARFCPDCGAGLAVADPRSAGSLMDEPAADGTATADSTTDEPATDPTTAATSTSDTTSGTPTTASPTTGTNIDVRQDVGTQSGGSVTGVDLGGVSGPVNVNQQGDSFKVQLGDVGAGGQVAVGKNITQSGAGGAAYSAADRAALADELERVTEALASPDVPPDRRLLGTEFLRQLKGTLLREDGVPDAAVVQVCGDWLLDNIPTIRPTLAAALTGPAGARALAAAGDAAVGWGRARLGGGGPQIRR